VTELTVTDNDSETSLRSRSTKETKMEALEFLTVHLFQNIHEGFISRDV